MASDFVMIELRYEMFKFSRYLAMYMKWCQENNVQWLPVYTPDQEIRDWPSCVEMMEEDAIAFKLKFGL